MKFVPAERVKYAGACEIACGSEIRLRRVKERILFHIATNATVVSFDYNEKVFGNIVLKLEIGKDTHTFITDRGKIYHNGKMLCDSSYHYTEKEDTFSKLLQLIKQELKL